LRALVGRPTIERKDSMNLLSVLFQKYYIFFEVLEKLIPEKTDPVLYQNRLLNELTIIG